MINWPHTFCPVPSFPSSSSADKMRRKLYNPRETLRLRPIQPSVFERRSPSAPDCLQYFDPSSRSIRSPLPCLQTRKPILPSEQLILLLFSRRSIWPQTLVLL